MNVHKLIQTKSYIWIKSFRFEKIKIKNRFVSCFFPCVPAINIENICSAIIMLFDERFNFFFGIFYTINWRSIRSPFVQNAFTLDSRCKIWNKTQHCNEKEPRNRAPQISLEPKRNQNTKLIARARTLVFILITNSLLKAVFF